MIGVSVEDLRLPPKDGLRVASDMQFRAVELGASAGDLAPSGLSKSGRRHLRRYAEGLGLRLSALTADLPGLRLTDPKTVDERIARTCDILELAADLSVPVVSGGVGALTHPETGEPSDQAMAALDRIGAFADSHDVHFALRPSVDTGVRMAGLLRELGCPAIRVCLDPAEVVMSGANPLSLLEHVIEHISLVHARDGKAGRSDLTGHEAALGQGDVDLLGLFAMTHAAEYAGPYIIRRKESAAPVEDIGHSREVLTGLLSRAT